MCGMYGRFKLHSVTLAGIVSFCLYCGSMVLAYYDKTFAFRWHTFWLHIISVAIFSLTYVVSHMRWRDGRKVFHHSELLPFLIVLLAAECVNFVFLGTYQFVSISDELRDGGLYALKIASGEIKNIFGYGAYKAHGLIIPSFTQFTYYVFGSTVYTYRVPSALLSTIDVLIVYLVVRRAYGKFQAISAGIFLALLPLHILFARSQVVLGSSFLFSSLLIVAVWNVLEKKNGKAFAILGIVSGFTLGLHAAVRVLAVGSILWVSIVSLLDELKSSQMWSRGLKKWTTHILVLATMVFVGFGPRILFTPPEVFFHTSRLSETVAMTDRSVGNAYSKVVELQDRYVQSLMGYVYEPLMFFSRSSEPMLNPIASVFFLLGLGYVIFGKRDVFGYYLVSMVLAMPLVVSAITDEINADHRYAPLFAYAVIVTALGLTWSINKIRQKPFKVMVVGIVFLSVVWRATMFFIQMPAHIGITPSLFLMTHVFNSLSAEKSLQFSPTQGVAMYAQKPTKNLCVYLSETDHERVQANYGVFEQERYFFPQTSFSYEVRPSINEGEVFVVEEAYCDRTYEELSNASYRKSITIECDRDIQKVECPLGYGGDFQIRVSVN